MLKELHCFAFLINSVHWTFTSEKNKIIHFIFLGIRNRAYKEKYFCYLCLFCACCLCLETCHFTYANPSSTTGEFFFVLKTSFFMGCPFFCDISGKNSMLAPFFFFCSQWIVYMLTSVFVTWTCWCVETAFPQFY